MTGIRDRYNAFISRHEMAWELVFAGLALVFVLVALVPDSAAADTIDLVLTLVFFAEFTSRIAASRDRRAYLRGHWIDLVALIPVARSLRMLRLLRLLRLIRAFAGVYRALDAAIGLAGHKGLAKLLIAWVAVMAICSIALYVAEQGVNAAVTSPFDALWWGVVTLSTVGYGDVYPVTPEGRLAATALMVLGIGLYSAITAIATSFLVRDDPGQTADRLRALAELRDAGLITEEEFADRRATLLALL